MRVIAKVMAIPTSNIVLHRAPQKGYQCIPVVTGSCQIGHCQLVGLVLPALSILMAAGGFVLFAVRPPTAIDRPCVGCNMADFVGKDSRKFAFASKCPVDARGDHDDAGGNAIARGSGQLRIEKETLPAERPAAKVSRSPTFLT